MNIAQRVVILIGCVLIFIALVWPPWLLVFHTSQVKNQRMVGYHFIFRPPELIAAAPPDFAFSYHIDRSRLEIEVIGLLLLTGLLYAALKSRAS